MANEISTAELTKKLTGVIKNIRTELQDWHAESKENQKKINDLQKRLDEISTKAVPPNIEEELDDLRHKLALMPVKGMPEGSAQTIQLMFADQLKELEDLNKENIENTKEIKQLRRQLDSLSKQSTASPGLDKDLTQFRAQMQEVAESTQKFNNLKQILLKHNEEFEDLYSSIGKEKVELDNLHQVLENLKNELVDWTGRNQENTTEIMSIKTELTTLNKALREKDLDGKVSGLSHNLEMLADRIEKIQRAEREILSQQEKMVRFDKGLKELVRKAVIASMSRREFEGELDKLESSTGAIDATALTTPEHVPPRTMTEPPAKEPPEKDVMAKLQALRMNLEKPNPEQVAGDPLMKAFTEFEAELTGAKNKKAVWDSARDRILNSARSGLTAAKERIGTAKAGGQDVSKVSLLATKFEIGLVSLETTFSIQNQAKAREIVAKLAGLKKQLDDGLKQLD